MSVRSVILERVVMIAGQQDLAPSFADGQMVFPVARGDFIRVYQNAAA